MKFIVVLWSFLLMAGPFAGAMLFNSIAPAFGAGWAFGAESYKIGEKRTLRSDILKERRSYFVSLPDSYNDRRFQKKYYPVIYILDGDRHFGYSSGIVHYMGFSFQIPEMIVIGVSNTRHRMRDLTPTYSIYSPKGVIDEKSTRYLSSSGGGKAFLQFMEQELIPEIDRRYRTMPYRTFVGHSLGGLTVVHSLFSQPTLFQNYIAIDSSLWWERSLMIRKLEEFTPSVQDEKKRLFLSLADHDPQGSSAPMKSSNLAFAKVIEKKDMRMKVKFEFFPGEDHTSVPLMSLYKGLLHVFQGFKPDERYIHSVADLSSHFEIFSEQTGVKFLPPEKIVDSYARGTRGQAAMAFLELNLKNYPSSLNAIKKMERFKEEYDLE